MGDSVDAAKAYYEVWLRDDVFGHHSTHEERTRRLRWSGGRAGFHSIYRRGGIRTVEDMKLMLQAGAIYRTISTSKSSILS